MESNVYKGSKTDFSYFVTMTLQNRMPWKMLSSILINLAPTLDETRKIICILLRELESLHCTLKRRDIKQAKYQNSDFTAEIQKNYIEHYNKTLETEMTTNEIQEHVEQISVPGNETIEDEVEVLEVVKESMNDAILLDISEDTKSSYELVNDDHDDDTGNGEESMGEIDNEWYTFVKNAKTFVPKTDTSV